MMCVLGFSIAGSFAVLVAEGLVDNAARTVPHAVTSILMAKHQLLPFAGVTWHPALTHYHPARSTMTTTN